MHTIFGIPWVYSANSAPFNAPSNHKPLLPAIMALSQLRRGHNKKEKEAARKRGPSLLSKGCGLGRKARVVSGAFYYEPTHHVFKMQCHLPRGETLPDLNGLVRTYFHFWLCVSNTCDIVPKGARNMHNGEQRNLAADAG